LDALPNPALGKTYGMQVERRMLASGRPIKVPQESLYVIDVSTIRT
jgi:hypothetical protein